ncbi:MAG: polysaccharide ABC transporter ATP-binding protein [Bacteroidia bacterium]|nr:polysaccharide ABC transporter ATP-binding protein [Bacteroidia bacterium]
MSSTVVISTHELSKRYYIDQSIPEDTLRGVIHSFLRNPLNILKEKPKEHLWALQDVSIEIMQGEVVGIIGKNGSGKSTLLKILTRVTRPTKGKAYIRGRVGSLLEAGTGFHPDLTGRENIYFSGVLLGMTRQEIRKKFDDIVGFAELKSFIDTSIKHYSSGMITRLGFAVAAHLETEILIIDEALAVGDLYFQRKCLQKMEEVSRSSGRTILFVSHQMDLIRKICHRVIWLHQGRVRMIGTPDEVIPHYERSLLLSNGSTHSTSGINVLPAQFLHWYLGPSQQNYVLHAPNAAQVIFVLRVDSSIRSPHYTLHLHDSEGHLLWSDIASLDPLLPGTYELSYDFPLLPLLPGSYQWRITLYDGKNIIEKWDAVPLLQVESPNYARTLFSHRGVMQLPYKREINCQVPSSFPS